MDRAQLKSQGKTAFMANYLMCVIASILLSLGAGGSFSVSLPFGRQPSDSSSSSDSSGAEVEMDQDAVIALLLIIVPIILGIFMIIILVGITIGLFVFKPIEIGTKGFFVQNLAAPAQLDCVGTPFKVSYLRNVKAMFFVSLFTFLWGLLFVIPGIVKGYSYRLVPYILAEDPNIDARAAVEKSKQMMNGHKAEAFVLDLSFIGWHLLSVLTFGILELAYVAPYQASTNAAFYASLRNNSAPQFIPYVQ